MICKLGSETPLRGYEYSCMEYGGLLECTVNSIIIVCAVAEIHNPPKIPAQNVQKRLKSHMRGLIRGCYRHPCKVNSIRIVSAVAENPSPQKIPAQNAQKRHFWAILGQKIQIPAKIWVPARNLTSFLNSAGSTWGVPPTCWASIRHFWKVIFDLLVNLLWLITLEKEFFRARGMVFRFNLAEIRLRNNCGRTDGQNGGLV